jgi:hypothetical protein
VKYFIGFVVGAAAGIVATKAAFRFDLMDQGKRMLNDSRRWLQKQVETLSFKLWTGDDMIVKESDLR